MLIPDTSPSAGGMPIVTPIADGRQAIGARRSDEHGLILPASAPKLLGWSVYP
jgi:hypothetical protein